MISDDVVAKANQAYWDKLVTDEEQAHWGKLLTDEEQAAAMRAALEAVAPDLSVDRKALLRAIEKCKSTSVGATIHNRVVRMVQDAVLGVIDGPKERR